MEIEAGDVLGIQADDVLGIAEGIALRIEAEDVLGLQAEDVLGIQVEDVLGIAEGFALGIKASDWNGAPGQKSARLAALARGLGGFSAWGFPRQKIRARVRFSAPFICALIG